MVKESNLLSDASISHENWRRLSQKQSDLIDVRKALINELSSSTVKNSSDPFNDLKQLYRNEFSENNLHSYIDGISVVDKIELCRCCFAEHNLGHDLGEMLFGQDEKCSTEAIGKVAYIKNNYSDAAYLTFSKSISSPRSIYLSSIQSVCEEVYSGACEYCLLPIETDLDGKLMTFYSTIDKYELKIHSVCTVRYADNHSFTKFALLKKSISGTGIFSASQAYINKRMLEVKISQTSQNDSPLYDILKAADACSMKLMRVDSLPLSYNKDLLGYYVVFSVNQADFKSFLLYLALEFPQSYVIGFYSSVN